MSALGDTLQLRCSVRTLETCQQRRFSSSPRIGLRTLCHPRGLRQDDPAECRGSAIPEDNSEPWMLPSVRDALRTLTGGGHARLVGTLVGTVPGAARCHPGRRGRDHEPPPARRRRSSPAPRARPFVTSSWPPPTTEQPAAYTTFASLGARVVRHNDFTSDISMCDRMYHVPDINSNAPPLLMANCVTAPV